MIKFIDLIVSPEQAFDKDYLKEAITKQLKIEPNDINEFIIVRKSIDARKSVKYNLRIQIATNNDKLPLEDIDFRFNDISKEQHIIIAGAGPAGYFAGLKCLINGLKPIIIERGKSVEERKHDIAKINRGESPNPDSNFAFGEGGAGTYSDGKLYTRSKKRGNVELVLKLLVFFGADKSILTDAHPHIGTDKLSSIIKNIRTKIIECGGEVHFNSKMDKIIISSGKISEIKCANGKSFKTEKLILATGHSARDIYRLLDDVGIEIEAKDFALGIRVEHPQVLIDKIQYKREERGKYLPAASYSLTAQVDGRGVYSFCMCPGGIIVPAATADKEIVVNGMSSSQRNSDYANSGIVVEIKSEDLKEFSEHGIFAGLEFQKHLERLAYLNSGTNLTAPAQRLTEFISGKISSHLPDCSYNPGIISSPMHFWLPENIVPRLRTAFKDFDRKMKGFITEDAVVVGVESRTSSPVKIPRDTYRQHIQIKGIYPCGEGAGYAGGIVSAAIDGMLAVESIKPEKT
jgi:uncharacterized protein